MAQRSSFRIKPLTILLLVVGVALLVVGIVFFVEPGHHVKRGLLAIVLAAACGVAAFYVQRKTQHVASRQ
jgi:drug/metabolite transporter (DMT)-like permease